MLLANVVVSVRTSDTLHRKSRTKPPRTTSPVRVSVLGTGSWGINHVRVLRLSSLTNPHAKGDHMHLVHGILAACSILLLAPIARADCIITRTAGDAEADNGLKVLKTMTGVGDGDVKRINTGEPDQEAKITAAANGCSGKVYFVGHAAEFSIDDIKNAVANIDSITEAAVYKCNCKGGQQNGAINKGKVKFCLDKVIWPAHIKTAIGFLIKPDEWAAMNYQQGAVDLAAAGDDLLVAMKKVHDCPTFTREYEKAKELNRELQRTYTQKRTDENKRASQEAFRDMEEKEKRYDGCKNLRSPETVLVLTKPGPIGPTTVTKVKYDGTVTPP